MNQQNIYITPNELQRQHPEPTNSSTLNPELNKFHTFKMISFVLLSQKYTPAEKFSFLFRIATIFFVLGCFLLTGLFYHITGQVPLFFIAVDVIAILGWIILSAIKPLAIVFIYKPEQDFFEKFSIPY